MVVHEGGEVGLYDHGEWCQVGGVWGSVYMSDMYCFSKIIPTNYKK